MTRPQYLPPDQALETRKGNLYFYTAVDCEFLPTTLPDTAHNQNLKSSCRLSSLCVGVGTVDKMLEQ